MQGNMTWKRKLCTEICNNNALYLQILTKQSLLLTTLSIQQPSLADLLIFLMEIKEIYFQIKI